MGNGTYVKFDSQNEAKEYLENMSKTDIHHDIFVNSVVTGTDDDGKPVFTAKTTEGEEIECNILDVAMRSLERRSGDDASGHQMMSKKQIMASMNNYWKLHNAKEISEIVIRDGGLLQMESSQYVHFEQSELFNKVIEFLEDKYADKYSFVGGSYQHSMTEVCFALKDALNESYKKAWQAANLGEALLDRTKIFLRFKTNDVGTSVAGVSTEMNVSGTRVSLGEPVNVMHRNGHGSMTEFRKALDDSVVTLQEELDALVRLMSIDISFPEHTTVEAIKETGLISISKKACKELVNDMLFTGTTSAYMLYLYINGFLQTEHGMNLSEERKLKAINACRKLLTVDWKKWDMPGSITL